MQQSKMLHKDDHMQFCKNAVVADSINVSLM